MEFWAGFGVGLNLGWGAAWVIAILIKHYDRTRGYDRARRF